ncbi:glycosyltransferase [Ferruginibacter yonginensis]|uniref:Glycosyltransferase n=1 Tax=Ferruginibacter yonginensis TaxID=1310416 RepID=A0ABV8QQG1_9BACT
MKIVQVLQHFLPQQTAGTEVYTYALSKALLQQGHEVTVVIPGYGATATTQYVYEGITVIQYAEPSVVDRALIMGERAPDGLTNFTAVIKNVSPDLVHFQAVGGSNGVGILHVTAVHSMAIPIVTTLHLAGYSCISNNLLFKDAVVCDGIIDVYKCSSCALHQKGLRGAKLSMVHSLGTLMFKAGFNSIGWGNSLGTALAHPFLIQSLQHRLLQLAQMSSKLVVLTKWYQQVLLQNGVAASTLKLIQQGLPSSSSFTATRTHSTTLRLVFVGRIGASKGLHLLLKAMQTLPVGAVSLSVYGPETEPDYVAECKEMAQHLPVTWGGIINAGAMVATLQAYDCLVLPSVICEMSPLVIQEAFAAGIPVIASNVYGNAEQITDGVNGWLFDFNSATSLQQKIQLLIQTPALLETARTQIPAVTHFETVAHQYQQLYKSILAL